MHVAAIRTLILFASALALACRPAGDQPPLRVMSWNIAAGAGGLDSIAATIRAVSPDIVGLQEVDVHWSERSAFADQATELARAVGMEVRFAPIYSLAAGDSRPPREFGVAILSRHPILASRNHEISRLSTQVSDPEPRRMPGFLEAVIDIGGTRVRVFDTHLDYRADPRVRAMQVREMLEIVRAASGPTVLLGDLNAPPEAAELAPLFEVLRDAWDVAAERGFTYPAAEPAKRIDYVLASPHFRVSRARVIESRASDHLPVVAWLGQDSPGNGSR